MNFIYFVCHDLGRHLGCYGRKVKTPQLDQFAASAFRFDQAFCNTAVCSPSRGACMTGRYAHNNGMLGLSHFGWRIAPGVKTVVDYFNEVGYETVHCGLSHEGEELCSRYQVDFEISYRSLRAENAVDDAIAWLRGRKKQGRSVPFYLNIGTMETHPSVWRRDEDGPGVPSRLFRDYGGPVPLEEVTVPPPTPDIPITRDEFSRFESSARFLDTEFGRLLREVDSLALNKDTTVIFTTDHGMNDWHGKGYLYDRGMEIALLLRPPQPLQKPAGIPDLIQNMDLTPTLLKAAGLPLAEALQGRSFWPIITGEPYRPHQRIFLEWNFGGPADDYSPIRAVRTLTHKYLRNYGPHHYGTFQPDEIKSDFSRKQLLYKRFKNYGPAYQHPVRMRPSEELFQLKEDPNELNNLAFLPACAETLQKLSSEVDEWMRSTNDPVLRGEKPQIPAEPGFRYH